VTFIATFLAGGLTSRFLLRIVVVAVLAGGIFAYYVVSLRGTIQGGAQRLFFVAACVAVAIGLFGGLAANGSPSYQRVARIDQQRTVNLHQIVETLHNRWSNTKGYTLPLSLSDAAIGYDSPTHAITRDPVTNVPYEYRRVSSDRYQLCATFDSDTRNDPRIALLWRHGTGSWCYVFNVMQPVGYDVLGPQS
jgi:hypothetical protein